MFNRQSNSNSNSNSNQDWKADAFLNLYLPRHDGTRAKLGAIALKGSNDTHQAIMLLLAKEPAALERIIEKLMIEYHVVSAEATSDLDI